MPEADGVVNHVDTGLDSSLETENITVVGDSLALEAMGDRIILREDKFKTGFECKTCNGEKVSQKSGYGAILDKTTVTCDMCAGTGYSTIVKGATCKGCSGTGELVCPTCNGKGALIIAPDEAQKRPSSGTIVSVGPEVNNGLQVGDRVLYSQFMGTGIDFKQRGVVRVMRCHEVFARIYGVGDLGKAVR